MTVVFRSTFRLKQMSRTSEVSSLPLIRLAALSITLHETPCSTEFFEDCIKEEEYEAQKLDILRDAVRAKVSYSQESSRLSVSDDVPNSPTGLTSSSGQLPPLPEQNGHEILANGSDTANNGN